MSAVRMSNSSLRIVGNQQARAEASAAAQQAIEKVIGSATSFYTPAAQNFMTSISTTTVSRTTRCRQPLRPACRWWRRTATAMTSLRRHRRILTGT
ncbi:hypothetical protein ACTMU2_22435 [Cupriavidus basilensis]